MYRPIVQIRCYFILILTSIIGSGTLDHCIVDRYYWLRYCTGYVLEVDLLVLFKMATCSRENGTNKWWQLLWVCRFNYLLSLKIGDISGSLMSLIHVFEFFCLCFADDSFRVFGTLRKSSHFHFRFFFQRNWCIRLKNEYIIIMISLNRSKERTKWNFPIKDNVSQYN